MKNKQFNRLIIALSIITGYLVKVLDCGKNPAYTSERLPGVVFMQYREGGETFFTMLDMADYQKIKDKYWTGTNNYVSTCREGKTVYLHRELCPNLQAGQYAHHKGSKFDNRSEMLQAVTPAQHDRHRTYCGDMSVDVKDGYIVVDVVD